MANSNILTKEHGWTYYSTLESGIFAIIAEDKIYIGSTENSFIKKYYQLLKSKRHVAYDLLQQPHKFHLLHVRGLKEDRAFINRLKEEYIEGQRKTSIILIEDEKESEDSATSDIRIKINQRFINSPAERSELEQQVDSLLEYCELMKITPKAFIQTAISVFKEKDIYSSK